MLFGNFQHILSYVTFWYFHSHVHFLTSLNFYLHKRIEELWVWNDGRKMDEGVKISKSKIWANVVEMTDLHIKSALKKYKIFTAFISSAVEISPYIKFKRIKINVIILKSSSMNFRRNFLLFGHQKWVNCLNNTGVTKFVQLASWRGGPLFFVLFCYKLFWNFALYFNF